MKAFLTYFFGAGEEVEFTLFGMSHFAPIIAMILVIVLIIKIKIKSVKVSMRKRFVTF